jgi:hypothetical protein
VAIDKGLQGGGHSRGLARARGCERTDGERKEHENEAGAGEWAVGLIHSAKLLAGLRFIPSPASTLN